MYCSHCGKPIPEGADYCLNCGCAVNGGSRPSENDSSSFGFALLGFLFPLIGLVLYFVYDDKRPKRAKSVGKGALVGVITRIVLSILLTVAAFFFSFSVMDAAVSGEASDIPIFGSIINEIVEELDNDGTDKCEVAIGDFVRVQRTLHPRRLQALRNRKPSSAKPKLEPTLSVCSARRSRQRCST